VHAQCDSSVEVCLLEARVQADGHVVAADRLVQKLQLQQGIPLHLLGFLVLGVEVDHPVKQLECLVLLAEVLERYRFVLYRVCIRTVQKLFFLFSLVFARFPEVDLYGLVETLDGFLQEVETLQLETFVVERLLVLDGVLNRHNQILAVPFIWGLQILLSQSIGLIKLQLVSKLKRESHICSIFMKNLKRLETSKFL